MIATPIPVGFSWSRRRHFLRSMWASDNLRQTALCGADAFVPERIDERHAQVFRLRKAQMHAMPFCKHCQRIAARGDFS